MGCLPLALIGVCLQCTHSTSRNNEHSLSSPIHRCPLPLASSFPLPPTHPLCPLPPPFPPGQGADLSRGLLQFAEGKPLGEHGMFWLYVQVCTVGGGWPRAAGGSWMALRLAARSWLLCSPPARLPRRRAS